MITYLQESQLPETYARFVELLQGKPWLKTTEKLELQLKANPFSRDQIHRENRVAYGLKYFDADGMALISSDHWPTVQHAMTFAAQVCELIDQSDSEQGKSSYLGRVRGAFSNPDEMRAIRFEHLAAMTLFKKGAQIEWPETKAGPERFDILATISGGALVEVECKSCSADKGRPITEKDAARLFSHLVKGMMPATNRGEVLMLKIRVPKRLPTSDSGLARLADDVKQAFDAGETVTGQGILVTHHRYTSPQLAKPLVPKALMRGVYTLTSRFLGDPEGPRVVIVPEQNTTALCLEVCSGRPNEFFEAMWETAKHAIQKQMTHKNPGALMMRLEGLTKGELEQFGKEQSNPLASFAHKVLADKRHLHLACLVFVSDENMTVTSQSSEAAQSCSYVLSRDEGQFPALKIGELLLGEKL